MIRIWTTIFLVCFLAVFITRTCGWGQEEITHKMFRLNNMKASDMERLVKIFLSKEGMTVSDDRTFTLIVKDYPSVLQNIEEFIKKQDIPQPHVSLSVQFNDGTSQVVTGWGVNAAVVNNYWRVGVWADSRTQSASASGTMNLVTMSNTWAEITVGENIPYPQWFFTYALDRGFVTVIPVYTQVSTGFAVCPVVRGSEIEITVAPQISYFADGQREVIRFTNAAVTMRVGNGQTVGFASGSGEQCAVIQRIFGSSSIRQSSSTIMTITPVIVRY